MAAPEKSTHVRWTTGPTATAIVDARVAVGVLACVVHRVALADGIPGQASTRHRGASDRPHSDSYEDLVESSFQGVQPMGMQSHIWWVAPAPWAAAGLGRRLMTKELGSADVKKMLAQGPCVALCLLRFALCTLHNCLQIICTICCFEELG